MFGTKQRLLLHFGWEEKNKQVFIFKSHISLLSCLFPLYNNCNVLYLIGYIPTIFDHYTYREKEDLKMRNRLHRANPDTLFIFRTGK